MIRKVFNLIKNSIIIAIIALTFYISLPIKIEKHISIYSGDNPTKLIKRLINKGYSLNFIDTYILSKLGTLYSGEIYFDKTSLTRINFLYKLTKSKSKLIRITLIEGETKEIFFKIVSKKLDINSSKLLKYYNKYAHYPEASIFPDTYFVPKKMPEERLIKFLLKSSNKIYKNIFKNYKWEDNKTKQLKILIIASIIQKEAGNSEEMPLIASVIYNRLKKNMRLQMDGTLNYAEYSHTKVTPQRIKNDNSHFNTYKHKGLPYSPIGSVSKEAIISAINPSSTDYLYFMRNTQGTHDFSKTFKAHRENIKNYNHRN